MMGSRGSSPQIQFERLIPPPLDPTPRTHPPPPAPLLATKGIDAVAAEAADAFRARVTIPQHAQPAAIRAIYLHQPRRLVVVECWTCRVGAVREGEARGGDVEIVAGRGVGGVDGHGGFDGGEGGGACEGGLRWGGEGVLERRGFVVLGVGD